MTEPEIKQLDRRYKSDIYGQWAKNSFRASVKLDKDLVQCPSAECEYGHFQSAEEDGNIFKCQVCQARYCIVCNVSMHDEMTCEQYQESQKPRTEKRKREIEDDGEAAEAKVRKISKPCPGCGVNIEKTYGCDHMTFKHLQHEPQAVKRAR